MGQLTSDAFLRLYVRHSYLPKTIVMCLKEFCAVFVQLVCYSRLGQVDLFQGGLILYMVLVVFAFPFLNSYLYGFLRFGMWVVKTPEKGMSWTAWYMRTVFQFVCMTLFQIMGAIAAAETVKAINSEWPDAVLHSVNDAPSGLTGYYPKIGVLYERPKAEINVGVDFLEEFFAVFILLVGLLHLIAKESEGLLINTYWNTNPIIVGVEEEGKPVESEVDSVDPMQSYGFTNETDNVKRVLGEVGANVGIVKENVEHIRSYLDGRPHRSKVTAVGDGPVEGGAQKRPYRLMPMPTKSTSTDESPSSGSASDAVPPLPGVVPATVGSNFRNSLDTASFFLGAEPPPDSTPSTTPAVHHKRPSPAIVAINSTLILHASILVMAVSRAFPSAHQSLHLTVFFSQMGYVSGDNETIQRVCGGYVACLVALGYYWFWYVFAGDERHDSVDGGQKGRGMVRRTMMEGAPGFMSSELRLPKYMRMGDDDGFRSA